MKVVGVRSIGMCLAAALALLAPVAAQAAPSPTAAPTRNATATAQVVRPANFRKLNDLDFAFLTVTAAGTAIIDPNTEAMTTTGGVLQVGGLPHAALFEAVSPTKTVVIIRAPKTAAILRRVGGTETMTVNNWTMSGQSRRNVAAHEPFEFKIGGTLNVAANQAQGTYVGTFEVDIQYP